jgi:hypothetical protein
MHTCTSLGVLEAVTSVPCTPSGSIGSTCDVMTQVEEPVFRTQLLPALPGYQGLFYGRCARAFVHCCCCCYCAYDAQLLEAGAACRHQQAGTGKAIVTAPVVLWGCAGLSGRGTRCRGPWRAWRC